MSLRPVLSTLQRLILIALFLALGATPVLAQATTPTATVTCPIGEHAIHTLAIAFGKVVIRSIECGKATLTTDYVLGTFGKFGSVAQAQVALDPYLKFVEMRAKEASFDDRLKWVQSALALQRTTSSTPPTLPATPATR